MVKPDPRAKAWSLHHQGFDQLVGKVNDKVYYRSEGVDF